MVEIIHKSIDFRINSK